VAGYNEVVITPKSGYILCIVGDEIRKYTGRI